MKVKDRPYFRTLNLYGAGLIGRIDVRYVPYTYTDPETHEPINAIRRNDERYYYINDHLGSVRAIVDSSGTTVFAQDTYPYGDIYRTYTLGGYADQKYDFTGKERDVETGLHYFGARYYDSDLGRWLQVDPQAEEAPEYTPYNYCFNNPLINVDPDGEFPWGVAAVGAIIGGASNAIIQVSVNMMRGDNLGEAVKRIDFVEVATSAAAGAIGSFVGVSASGLGKGSQIIINTVTDASLNAGTQYVQKGSVDADK